MDLPKVRSGTAAIITTELPHPTMFLITTLDGHWCESALAADVKENGSIGRLPEVFVHPESLLVRTLKHHHNESIQSLIFVFVVKSTQNWYAAFIDKQSVLLESLLLSLSAWNNCSPSSIFHMILSSLWIYILLVRTYIPSRTDSIHRVLGVLTLTPLSSSTFLHDSRFMSGKLPFPQTGPHRLQTSPAIDTIHPYLACPGPPIFLCMK